LGNYLGFVGCGELAGELFAASTKKECLEVAVKESGFNLMILEINKRETKENQEPEFEYTVVEIES
jgi:hypothetical protein